MYVRMLSGISLLGALAAVLVVAFGYQQEVSTFFGSGGTAQEFVAGAPSNAIGEARTLEARAKIDTLIQSATLETVGVTEIKEEELRKKLIKGDGGDALQDPIREGGVELHVVQGSVLVFCLWERSYSCIGYEPHSQIRGDYRDAPRIEQAIQKAALAMR